MTNHPNRGRAKTIFVVKRWVSMDTRTLAFEYETISRHKTRHAAEAAIAKLARAALRERETSPPEAFDLECGNYEIETVNK